MNRPDLRDIDQTIFPGYFKDQKCSMMIAVSILLFFIEVVDARRSLLDITFFSESMMKDIFVCLTHVSVIPHKSFFMFLSFEISMTGQTK